MQFLLAGLALLGIAKSATAASTLFTCNANDCYRQVKASAFPTRSASQDCSAFQTTTSTPTIITTVITSTATIVKRAPADAAVQGVAASRTIPSYASSCRSSAAYASACNCIGVSAYTATAAPVYAASTVYTTVTVPSAQPTFSLKVKYGADQASNDAIYIRDLPYQQTHSFGAVSDTTYNALFEIDPQTSGLSLVTPGGQYSPTEVDPVYNQPTSTDQRAQYLEAGDQRDQSQVKCKVSASFAFTCSYNGALGVFALCPDYSPIQQLAFLKDSSLLVQGCSLVTLTAVPIV